MSTVAAKSPQKLLQKVRSGTSKMSRKIVNTIGYYRQHMLSVLSFCILMICITGTFLTFCTSGSGSSLDGVHIPSDASAVISWAFGIIEMVFGDGDIDTIKSLTNIVLATDGNSMTINVGTYSFGAALGAVVLKIYAIFRNLAVMMLVIYFCIGLMEEISFNQMYIEKMVKKFVFFCIGLAVVANAIDLIFFIANCGTAITNQITSSITSTMPNYITLEQEILNNPSCYPVGGYDETMSIGDHIARLGNGAYTFFVYCFPLLLPYLAAWVANVVCQFTCWSRFLEILILGITSPIAFSDMARGNPGHSGAMRAVKNAIALALTGSMILLIIFFTGQLQGMMFTNGYQLGAVSLLSAGINATMLCIVRIGMITRANDIVKQALGMA